eukprot:TRINITY_DN3780_c0_g1_i11.p1 TRINITY_DN3780_c0_g1~~TRINITY_DN3780_c0_g1_i11.p1  ORF type:complete len:184 (+),score=26.91 TRINITY_DN3780_c0_g1_i11:1767-2318(+)
MIPSGPQLVCDFKFSLPMLFCLRVLGPSYLYFFLKPCTALSRDSPVLRGIVIDSRASISQATSTSSCASRKLERTQYRHVLIIRNLLASGVSISGAIALSLCLLGNSFHKKLFTWQLTTVMAQVVDLFLSGVSMFICCVFVWKVRSSRHLLSGEQEVGSSTKSQRGNAKSRRLNRFPDLSFID